MKYFLILVIIPFLLFSCKNDNLQTSLDTKTQQKKEVILALGDSLTAGYGIDSQDNYPSLLQKFLDENNYNYEVINAGVSGDTSENILSRAGLYLEKNPSIVILVAGGNDGLRGLSTKDLKENLIKIIKTFPKSKIILGGMDIPQNLGEEYRQNFIKIYKEIKDENEKIYFIPFFLEGVAGNKDLNISDMIHPNKKGYEIIVKNLTNFMETENILEK